MKKIRSLRTLACILLVALIAGSGVACRSEKPPAPDGGVITTPTTLTQAPEETVPTTAQEPTERPTIDHEKARLEYVKKMLPPKPEGTAQRLFSISMGGGFGTFEETAQNVWTVYANGTVDRCKLGKQTPAEKLSDADFQKVCSMINLDNVEDLVIEFDYGVADGGSTYIFLYDDQGELLLYKGGYCPKSEEYQELFWETYRILTEYIEWDRGRG